MFDYILTWSKYYIQLKKENNIFNKMNEFINELIQESINGNNITTLSEQIFLNNPKAKPTLYFFNIFFEFFTYYKLNFNETILDENQKEKRNIIKKISKEFEYILLNQKDINIKNSPINEMEMLEKKIDDYLFIRIVFLICSTVWTGNEKKFLKNENEIYSKYIVGNNKNSNITELEILFYSFDDDYLKDKNDYCNKGTPLIILIYHLFISFLNIGGTKIELEEYFNDLRLLITLIIISSSTLNSSETYKQKKWPKENQYKDVQFTVECILFNYLFFLYHRIKEFKKEINDYNSKLQNTSEQNVENLENVKKNLECLSILNRIYVKNLGYLLKILNKVYRGVKNEEKQKQGVWKMVKNIFKSQTEGVKNSGPFSLMENLYNECPTLSLNEENYN